MAKELPGYARKWRIVSDALEKHIDERPMFSVRNRIANDIIAGFSRIEHANTIATLDELNDLADGAVICEATGRIGALAEVMGERVVFWIGNECEDYTDDVLLPVTVLSVPTFPSGGNA